MSVVNSDNKNLWYAGGLHFECLKCGRCCSGPAGGYIWVSRPEIRLLAEYLKMTVRELKKAYLHRVGFRMTIIEDAQTRDCVFLRQGENGRQCSVYPVRPSQCRIWPFWLSNLTSPDSWNMAGQKCPGINRGTFYSCEEMQAKRAHTRWWSNDGSEKISQNEVCHSERTCPACPRMFLSGEQSRRSEESGEAILSKAKVLLLNTPDASASPQHDNKDSGQTLRAVYPERSERAQVDGLEIVSKEVSREVGLIYAWLDEQLNNSNEKGNCAACGNCCDFEKFGHRLYVTTPELMYFAEKIGASDVIASAPVLSKVEGAKFTRRSVNEGGQSQMTTGRCPYQSAVGSADGETSPKGGVEGPSTSLGMVSGSTVLSGSPSKGLSNHKCAVYPYRFSGCRIFSCKADADFQSDLTETVIKKFKSLCEKYQIPYRYVELLAALKDFSPPRV